MNAERLEYMKDLADEFAVPLNVVISTAQMLGESEDYDGLPTSLADYHWFMENQEEIELCY